MRLRFLGCVLLFRKWSGKTLQDFGAVRPSVLVPHSSLLHEQLELCIGLLRHVRTKFRLIEAETSECSIHHSIRASCENFVRDAVEVLEVGAGRVCVSACFSKVLLRWIEVLWINRQPDLWRNQVALDRADQKIKAKGSEPREFQRRERFLRLPVMLLVLFARFQHCLCFLFCKGLFGIGQRAMEDRLLPLKYRNEPGRVCGISHVQGIVELEAQELQKPTLQVCKRNASNVRVLQEREGMLYSGEFASFVLTHGFQLRESVRERCLFHRGLEGIVYPFEVQASGNVGAVHDDLHLRSVGRDGFEGRRVLHGRRGINGKPRFHDGALVSAGRFAVLGGRCDGVRLKGVDAKRHIGREVPHRAGENVVVFRAFSLRHCLLVGGLKVTQDALEGSTAHCLGVRPKKVGVECFGLRTKFGAGGIEGRERCKLAAEGIQFA